MRYNLTIGELIDRLGIVILKIAHGADLIEEQNEIILDINDHGLNGKMIHAILALGMVNATIWANEDAARNEAEQNPSMLLKTHKLNLNRSEAKAAINNMSGQRIDPKLNYLPGIWKIIYA